MVPETHAGGNERVAPWGRYPESSWRRPRVSEAERVRQFAQIVFIEGWRLNGRDGFMLGDADDIHVEPAIGDSNAELFRAMLSVSSDPILALDDDRRIVAIDDELVELIGYDEEALLGEPATFLLGEDDLEALEMMVAKVAREGDTMAGEFDLFGAEGSVRRCELRVAIAEDDETVVAAVRDVTGLRRREERIEVLDRVLRHNIRNKVGSVLGYLDTVLEESDDETARLAKIARSEADELRALSDKARRFHKLLELDPVRGAVEDLEPIVSGVLDDAAEDRPDAEFEAEVPSHPPVFVDEELVTAALDEVVGNALEHHDRQTPRVELSTEVADEKVYLRVADDGPGIPPEERAAIVEGTEQPLYHASGLGIWFVKWCLRLSGGTLTLESREPRGTVVVFVLPRADSHPGT
jgi:PAS domain S-box-containing protein